MQLNDQRKLFKTKGYPNPYDYKQGAKRGRHVARNSQLTGLFWGVWGQSPQPPEAIGQRWSRGHNARGQGQGHKKNPRPRPRTALPRTEPLEAKDRNARGQGQGPRTQVQVFSKKKSSKIFFRRSPIHWRTQNLLG